MVCHSSWASTRTAPAGRGRVSGLKNTPTMSVRRFTSLLSRSIVILSHGTDHDCELLFCVADGVGDAVAGWHGKLMAQHQDLDLVGGVGPGHVAPASSAVREHLVDQLRRRRWIMPWQVWRRITRSVAIREISGTHRVAACLLPCRLPGGSSNDDAPDRRPRRPTARTATRRYHAPAPLRCGSLARQ